MLSSSGSSGVRQGRGGRIVRAAAVLWVVATLVPVLDVHAQAPEATASSSDVRVYRTIGTRMAIGRDVYVARDEEVRDAVVVLGGSLKVDGRVRDGLVVIGGNVDLGPESTVSGDVVLVGGTLRRAEGARLYGSVSDVRLGDWSGWTLGVHVWPWVEFADMARWLGLAGAILRVGVLTVLTMLIVLIARAPVSRVGRAAAAEPGRAMAIGLLAEILFVPALIIGSTALAITLIGIPLLLVLLPLVFLASVVALLLGFTALACQVGEWIENRLGWRAHSAVVATALGLLAIVGPTLVSRALGVAPEPLRVAAFGLLIAGALLEFAVWTMGLGATLMTGFGRRSVAPPPVPVV